MGAYAPVAELRPVAFELLVIDIDHIASKPPRPPPKIFILPIKTHKHTVLINIPSTSTVDDIKAEVLDALQSGVVNAPVQLTEYAMDVDEDADDLEWKVPQVETIDDFELARQVKEKGRPTGLYEVLEVKSQLKNVLANWDPVFVQFKDPNGGLLPVKVSVPPVFPEEEEEPSLSAARKGKRKAD
ncbi:hypothetical protein GSI_01125 [Ganoderma sinense ZZ0214-1]|uniref:Ubiquitin-like domain-containing protein n=1 Tax=Ganoderma sinense ZZ0214-1 TaxID=1077348 RepID=A0A2G8SUI0_9APHY|nr:hypothetical protein GSI_01125 [Ganoderma sinense ZZ0214-1]